MKSELPKDLPKSWIERMKINEWRINETEKQIIKTADDFFKGSDVNQNQKIAWLLKAVTMIDLTTLAGDDTESNVTRLSLKAMNPVLNDFLTHVKMDKIRTAAVCVYPARVADAVAALTMEDSKETVIPVAAVATGFPSGQYSLETRLAEIKFAIGQGATEIDVVIDRSLAIRCEWDKLYDELKQMKAACGTAHMKTILAVGELPTWTHVYRASMVAMFAGSDFIKTSTGKEAVNATIPVGIVMASAIRDFYQYTGNKVGLKAAGGLRTAHDALTWLVLVHEELGSDWLTPDLFRIGASSLLAAIEAELYKTYPDLDLFNPIIS